MNKVVIFHSEKIEFELDADGNTIFIRSRTEFSNSHTKVSVVDVKPWPINTENSTILAYLAETRRKLDTAVTYYTEEE